MQIHPLADTDRIQIPNFTGATDIDRYRYLAAHYRYNRYRYIFVKQGFGGAAPKDFLGSWHMSLAQI